MEPLELVGLTGLMDQGIGSPEIRIGLIDGPVAFRHPDLSGQHLREVPGTRDGACAQPGGVACLHGTFVAGILVARRGSVAPAICPGCTLLVRPIFREAGAADGMMPVATTEELARAILECTHAGARIINISSSIVQAKFNSDRILGEALDYAARRGIIVVAAAGNQAVLGSTAITGHPWVIHVAGYDRRGRPAGQSSLGKSIGRRGLGAPAESITSLGAHGEPLTLGGTSAAAPFVTGAIALLWSAFPAATAARIKGAVTLANVPRRPTVVPPLLDARAAYRILRGGWP